MKSNVQYIKAFQLTPAKEASHLNRKRPGKRFDTHIAPGERKIVIQIYRELGKNYFCWVLF